VPDLVPLRPQADGAEERLKALVLKGIASAHTRRAYETGLDQFSAWLRTRPPQPFSKELLAEYRASLLELNLSASTINLRLSPLRRLAREMENNNLLDLGTAIERTRGVKQQGKSRCRAALKSRILFRPLKMLHSNRGF